jgi:hypothetical protein
MGENYKKCPLAGVQETVQGPSEAVPKVLKTAELVDFGLILASF